MIIRASEQISPPFFFLLENWREICSLTSHLFEHLNESRKRDFVARSLAHISINRLQECEVLREWGILAETWSTISKFSNGWGHSYHSQVYGVIHSSAVSSYTFHLSPNATADIFAAGLQCVAFLSGRCHVVLKYRQVGKQWKLKPSPLWPVYDLLCSTKLWHDQI